MTTRETRTHNWARRPRDAQREVEETREAYRHMLRAAHNDGVSFRTLGAALGTNHNKIVREIDRAPAPYFPTQYARQEA